MKTTAQHRGLLFLPVKNRDLEVKDNPRLPPGSTDTGLLDDELKESLGIWRKPESHLEVLEVPRTIFYDQFYASDRVS